ncbi:MAG TPA: hypothetical protein VF125_00490 [Solirubrobacterales bacterium]
MSERPSRGFAAAVQRFNRSPELVDFVRRTRERTLGDDEFVDHLSTARAGPPTAPPGNDSPPVLERQGEVVKRLGDGLMAAFGEASSAVEAAFRANEQIAASTSTSPPTSPTP